MLISALVVSMTATSTGPAVGATHRRAHAQPPEQVEPAPLTVGMNTHFYAAPSDRPAVEMERLRAGGVTTIREPFKWNQIQPTVGRWKWELQDELMTAAATTGIDVLPVLCFSAAWASSDPSGGGDQMYPPKDPRDFARFASEVVARYGSDGTFWRERPALAQRPIRAVELWNEPWGHTYWKPAPDPRGYLRLVRPAAAAVKRADPRVDVVISGDLLQATSDHRFPVPWLEQLFAADARLSSWVDALSIHPYPNPSSRGPLDESMDARLRFSRIELISDVLVRRRADIPLWITEIGWTTGTSPTDVSETDQARHLDEALVAAQTTYRGSVQRFYAFTWDVDDGRIDTRYGLRRSDGSTKPAWEVLARRLTEP